MEQQSMLVLLLESLLNRLRFKSLVSLAKGQAATLVIYRCRRETLDDSSKGSGIIVPAFETEEDERARRGRRSLGWAPAPSAVYLLHGRPALCLASGLASWAVRCGGWPGLENLMCRSGHVVWFPGTRGGSLERQAHASRHHGQKNQTRLTAGDAGLCGRATA